MAANVSTDLNQFGGRMQIRAEQVLDMSENWLQAVVSRVGRNLVSDTPVKTGRARGNWLASIGVPRGDRIMSGTSSEADAFNRSIAPILSLIKPDDVVYIANNLWYIEDLNAGKSPQAAAGFVGRAVARGIAEGNALRASQLRFA